MKKVLGQLQVKTSHRQPRSLPFATVNSKFATVLSAGLAAASLLMTTPAFGQTAQNTIASGEKQNLTCVTEGQHLVCDVQQPGQAAKPMTFEQKPYVGTSEVVELTPVKRTALFNPELDSMLASGLLWTFYLSLPLSVMVAIWRYDQRAREQMAQLLQQVATLERIWRHPQTH